MRHQHVRSIGATIGSLIIAGAVGAAVVQPAGALSDVGFLAGASAQGFRSVYVVPGQFVVEQVWDFGGPIAQARLDPSGGFAYGSLPFPGEAAIVAPGLVANLAGLPSPPSYPFYASAQYPSVPSSNVSDPTGSYTLDAKADDLSATATVLSRGGPKEASVATSEASTSITNGDESVVATAASVTRGLSFGGVLTIGSAASQAEAKLADGQQVERSSKLTVTGVEVAGTPVELDSGGVDDKAANDALKAAGISVRVAQQEADANSASADFLEVTVRHPVPGGGGAEGQMVYRFGGASARIATGAAAAEEPSDASEDPTPATGDSGAAPSMAPDQPAAWLAGARRGS